MKKNDTVKKNNITNEKKATKGKNTNTSKAVGIAKHLPSGKVYVFSKTITTKELRNRKLNRGTENTILKTIAKSNIVNNCLSDYSNNQDNWEILEDKLGFFGSSKQKQINAILYKMFLGGIIPFIGDYINTKSTKGYFSNFDMKLVEEAKNLVTKPGFYSDFSSIGSKSSKQAENDLSFNKMMNIVSYSDHVTINFS